MKLPIPFTLWAAALIMPGGLFAEETVLLDENFAQGTRAVQKLPAESAWFSSGESGTLVASPGNMQLVPMQSSLFAIGYFTDRSAAEVAEGETLTLTIAFTMSNPANNSTGVRLALLDSGGKRTTADNGNVGAKRYNAYTGYGVFLNPPGTGKSVGTGSLTIRKRNSGLSNTLITSGDAYAALGAGGNPFMLEDGENYTLTLSLKNLGKAGLEVRVSLAGKNIDAGFSCVDADAPHFSFDTIVLAGMRASFESWKISRIRVGIEREGP